MTDRSGSIRFQQIDVLRGLAALWVLLSHYFPHWDTHLGGAPVLVPNEFGAYAVELFFVISGFVIFMTLDRCANVLDFAVMRFSRLYPAYWVTLILATLLGVVVFEQRFWLGGFVANATMLQEFVGVAHFDNVYWSLSVEMAFYANAAWLLALGWHKRPKVWLPIWLVAAGVWALMTHPVRIEQRDVFAKIFALDFASFFAIGIVFFDAQRHGWSRFSSAMVLLALGVEYALQGWRGVTAATIIALLFFAAWRGYLAFLVNRVTVWLGAISFSLYLVHRNLGYHTLDWLHAHGVPVVPAVLLTTVGALALATAVTFLVERPVLTTIRSWYASRRSVSA